MDRNTIISSSATDAGARHDRLRFPSWLAGAVLVLSVLTALWAYNRDDALARASRGDDALIVAS